METTPEQTTESAPEAAQGQATFAQATGLVYQVVGLVFSLGGCCFWSLSGLAQDEADVGARAGEWFLSGETGQWMVALQTAVTFMAGMGMIGAGMGMSAAIRSSAVVGMVSAGAMSLVWGAGAVVQVVQFESVGSALAIGLSLVMATAGVVLFLLGGVSRRDIIEHPRRAEDAEAGPF